MNKNDKINDLKKIVSMMLQKGSWPSFIDVLTEAENQGKEVTLSTARKFFSDSRYASAGSLISPDFILDFIVEYLEDYKLGQFLCPCAQNGLDFLYLVKRIQPRQSKGLTFSARDYKTARFLDKNHLVEWIHDDPLTKLNEIKSKVDAIFGIIPWEMEKKRVEFPLEDDVVSIFDTVGNIILLISSELLSKNGVGIFIVPIHFSWDKHPDSVFSNLSKFGLYIDSLLTIPKRTFSPITAVPAQVLFIKRVQSQHLFIGELTQNKAASDALLENLKKREDGEIPSLGALTKIETYKSLDSFIRNKNITDFVTSGGLSEVQLSQITLSINRTTSKDPDAFPDKINSIYLPLIGNSQAVTSKEDLVLKAQNYAQIEFNPEFAIAEYVAEFYNTEIGYDVREMLKTGAHILKISKRSLMKSSIYLPDLSTQTETLKTKSLIDDLKTQLDIHQSDLFNNPFKAQEIYDKITTLNREESFDYWIDTLPFPLASILWVYQTIQDPKEKFERLNHFFEALAIFTSVISLSAFASNPSVYSSYSLGWKAMISNRPVKFNKVSFGTWVNLGQLISK